MNKDQFSGKWKELKGRVKEKWGKLTDDDIAQINGKWDQLSGTLQKKYGWAREQADREINSWCASCEQNKGRHTAESPFEERQSSKFGQEGKRRQGEDSG